MEDPDGFGEVGNPTCGDMMMIYLKVKDDRIEDIKFKTLGCAAAIATSSATTDMAKGMMLKDALEITNGQIVESLGGLPAQKIHCSVLAADALKEAIYDYLVKNGGEVPDSLKRHHERITEAAQSGHHAH